MKRGYEVNGSRCCSGYSESARRLAARANWATRADVLREQATKPLHCRVVHSSSASLTLLPWCVGARVSACDAVQVFNKTEARRRSAAGDTAHATSRPSYTGNVRRRLQERPVCRCVFSGRWEAQPLRRQRHRSRREQRRACACSASACRASACPRLNDRLDRLLSVFRARCG